MKSIKIMLLPSHGHVSGNREFYFILHVVIFLLKWVVHLYSLTVGICTVIFPVPLLMRERASWGLVILQTASHKIIWALSGHPYLVNSYSYTNCVKRHQMRSCNRFWLHYDKIKTGEVARYLFLHYTVHVLGIYFRKMRNVVCGNNSA